MPKASFGFPTIAPTDRVLEIGSLVLDPNITYTVDDIASGLSGLFKYEKDEEGFDVLSCDKEIGESLTITILIQNNPVAHKPEPFIPLYRGNEFVGTRPPVHRYV